MAGVPGLVEIAVLGDAGAAADEWLAFEEKACGHVFQSLDFVRPWLLHVGAERGISPRIVIGRAAGGATLFILPFGIRSCFGARLLEWLGAEHADYHAGLFAPGFLAELNTVPGRGRAFVEAVVARLSPEADVAWFRRQPMAIDGHPNPFADWKASPHLVRAHRTRLAGDWEAYYRSKRNSSSRRHDRLKWEKMESLGPVSIIDAEKPAEMRRILGALFAQKEQSLAARGIPDMFASRAVRNFYEAVALKPYPAGPAHVSAIDVGGTIVAANWGLVRGKRYYYVMTSYDAGPVSRSSPGRALMHHLMRWSIARGIEEFDFTIGDEEFKQHWCEESEELRDSLAVLRPRGLALGAAIRAVHAAKPAIKRSAALSRLANQLRRRFATSAG